MTRKHTEGPWRVLPEEPDKDYSRVRGTRLGHRFKIANVHDGDHPREYAESQANARLIAAAPELLDALEDSLKALKAIQDDPFNLDMDAISMATTSAKSAIETATGEQT